MDAVALGELRELTGDGSQTFINNSSGTVSGDFYSLQFITDCSVSVISILGVSAAPLIGITIPAGTILHNVTSITISSSVEFGTVIGYSNPALTGNIPG